MTNCIAFVGNPTTSADLWWAATCATTGFTQDVSIFRSCCVPPPVLLPVLDPRSCFLDRGRDKAQKVDLPQLPQGNH